VFERSDLVTTDTTWLPKNAHVRYLSGLAEGLAPVAFQSDTSCRLLSQQLFVKPLDAQASIMRTLSEGETIWESHHRF
jgi:hypothetical protein